MKKGIFLLAMLLMLFSASCSQQKSNADGNVKDDQAAEEMDAGNFEAEYDWILPDFSYVNEDGEQVSKTDLLGEAWLANFVFTNCSTVCPPMTANLAKVQGMMKEAGLNNRIISFSVDPERDTPEVLKEFAGRFQLDLETWDFLTGYEQEEVKELAKSFKTLAEPEEGTDQFIHSTKIFLINEDGTIVKGYNGLQVPVEEIISDLKALR